MTDREIEGFSWKNRRRAIWANLTFSAGVIVYCLGWREADSVTEAAITMSFINIMGTIGSYAFGAAWENRK